MEQTNATSVATMDNTAAVTTTPSPLNHILAKLTLADKVIGGAAAMGFISVFLPAASVTVEFLGTKQSHSVAVFGDWRGKLGLLCFLAAGTLLFLMIQKGAAASKNLLYGLLSACGVAALMGIFLLIGASSSLSGVPQEMRELVKGGTSIGTYLFLLCGLAMAAGGFLKAKEQNLIRPVAIPATNAA